MEQKIIIYVKACEETAGKGQAKLQHLIGRELLQEALIRECQLDTGDDLEQQIEIMSNGKPVFKGLPIHFNISHCKGMVACALAPCPVGVDVESGRLVTEALIKKVCATWEKDYIRGQEQEERFLRIWTLKESYLKMTGEGLRVPLPSVSFRLQEPGEAWSVPDQALGGSGVVRTPDKMPDSLEDWRTPGQIQCSRGGFFYQKKLGPECILSVCSEMHCKLKKICYIT